ncbi:MAG: choice-of-anchor A family protein [Erysipelotrichaceae bacterium]
MAINFWTANDYNLFIFGNMSQNGGSATGRVWVGATALLINYTVGADMPVSKNVACLHVLGEMNIIGGTNVTQNSELDVLGTLTAYTMTHNNGVVPQPKSFSYRPYDVYPYNYLQCSSKGWGTLTPNATANINGSTLTISGTSTSINIVTLGNNIDMSTINNVHINVPINSTILINVIPTTVILGNFNTKINNVAITKATAAYLVWNLPNATNVQINNTLFGAVLAPFALANSTASSTIVGTLMALNLAAHINGVNNNFMGNLPDLYNPSTTGSCTTSSSTTTSTTTTTTTSSTTTATTTTPPPTLREQAIYGIITSVALEQTALAHIINAEGEKIQAALAMKLTEEELLIINNSVEETVREIKKLESILQAKLELFSSCSCIKPKQHIKKR